MTTATNDLFGVDFFDLQLHFARRVGELGGVSFLQAVGSHTNVYVRLGMGPRLDVNNPDWQDYLAGLATASEPAAWTRAVHARRRHIAAGSTVTDTEGCFSCALIEPGRARLHFHAGPGTAESPLAEAHLPRRRRELYSLVSRLIASSSVPVQIVGASWLYNLRAYRSLFPEPYRARLQPIAHPHQRMPLWGQFLRRDRSVRPEAGARFLEGIAQASSLCELDRCFPFAVLTSTSPAGWFRDRPALRGLG